MALDWILINKILLVFVSTSGIFLAFWVYFADRKNRINQTFALVTTFYSFWVLFDYLCYFIQSDQSALFFRRVTLSSVAAATISGYFFTAYFPYKEKIWVLSKKVSKAIAGLGIFLILISPFTDLLVKSVRRSDDIRFWVGGRFAFLFWGFIIFSSISFLYVFYVKYFKLLGQERLKVQYCFIGGTIFIITNLVFNVIYPVLFKSYKYYFLGDYVGVSWVLFTTYAVVRRQLFDIKVVLTDLLVGIMGVTLLVFPFVMPTNFLRALAGIVFLLFCFFGYYLIKAVREEGKRRMEAEGVAQEEAEMRQQEVKIRKEVERFKESSLKLKDRLTRVLSVEDIIFHINNTLIEALGVDKVSFALKQATSELYQFHKTIGFTEKDLAIILRDTALCSYLKEAEKPLLKEELQVIEDRLKESGISLLFPLFQKEKLMGIIFLGNKASGEKYSKADIDLLQALSYQISISLNDALLYEEIKKDKDLLEYFYKLTLGREVKMNELRRKVEELEGKLKEKGNKNNNGGSLDNK